MSRKKIIIILLSILLVSSYLFVAKWYIYHKIGSAGLSASDDRHTYVFNDMQLLPKEGIIYGAIGDSLTAGVGVNAYEQSYPFQLAQKIAGTSTKVTLLNFSYPGAKTEDVIRDLLPRVMDEKLDIITVLIGTNDVMNGKVTEVQFETNYETILSQLTTQKNTKINVISIPYIGTNSLFLPPFNYYYRDSVNKFNGIIKKLASKYKVNYIDLTTPTTKFASKVSDYYARDDFHLSEIGYTYWANILYDNLDK